MTIAFDRLLVLEVPALERIYKKGWRPQRVREIRTKPEPETRTNCPCTASSAKLRRAYGRPLFEAETEQGERHDRNRRCSAEALELLAAFPWRPLT